MPSRKEGAEGDVSVLGCFFGLGAEGEAPSWLGRGRFAPDLGASSLKVQSWWCPRFAQLVHGTRSKASHLILRLEHPEHAVRPLGRCAEPELWFTMASWPPGGG
jgi:hypothetical protein